MSENLEKELICKHCKRPIMKCDRCEYKCVDKGYVHMNVYTKDGKKIENNYKPHHCYYDKWDEELVAEPE